MKHFEATLWISGTILVLLFVSIVGWQEIERRHEIAAFLELQQNTVTATSRMQSPVQPLQLPLQTLVSPEPIIRPAVSGPGLGAPTAPTDVPIAILRIPAIGLVVPVNLGTGEKELRRGAGLVKGSPLPGNMGNVAIAAHRDSFFRGLKDVSVSDTIELDTLGHTQIYRITKLTVVQPTDVNVLADVGEPVLTLITCYPFYFVGHAPERFIVRAVATNFRR